MILLELPLPKQSEGTNSSTTTDLSDLTLPDKNASFEVCYICGDEFRRGTLSYTFAKQGRLSVLSRVSWQFHDMDVSGNVGLAVLFGQSRIDISRHR